MQHSLSQRGSLNCRLMINVSDSFITLDCVKFPYSFFVIALVTFECKTNGDDGGFGGL